MKNTLYLKTIFIGIAVSVAALLYFFIDARYSTIFPSCPFHNLTGLFCPGCGSQRALSSLLHGDIRGAIGYNVLLVISIPVLLFAAYVSVHNTFSHRKIRQQFFYAPAFAKSVLVIVVMFWIARNVPVYPFLILAPH